MLNRGDYYTHAGEFVDFYPTVKILKIKIMKNKQPKNERRQKSSSSVWPLPIIKIYFHSPTKL